MFTISFLIIMISICRISTSASIYLMIINFNQSYLLTYMNNIVRDNELENSFRKVIKCTMTKWRYILQIHLIRNQLVKSFCIKNSIMRARFKCIVNRVCDQRHLSLNKSRCAWVMNSSSSLIKKERKVPYSILPTYSFHWFD